MAGRTAWEARSQTIGATLSSVWSTYPSYEQDLRGFQEAFAEQCTWNPECSFPWIPFNVVGSRHLGPTRMEEAQSATATAIEVHLPANGFRGSTAPNAPYPHFLGLLKSTLLHGQSVANHAKSAFVTPHR